jgi:hypothetical protein
VWRIYSNPDPHGVSAKLAAPISDIDHILPTNVDIGTDDEKAIEIDFLSTKRSLCTKHLKENVSDYLKNDRKQLIDLIFGEHGILNAADAFQFEERCVQLLTTENTSVFNKCILYDIPQI